MKFSIRLLCLISFICSDLILLSQSLDIELANDGIVFPSMSLDESNKLAPNIEFDEPSTLFSNIRLTATDNLLATAYNSRQNDAMLASYHHYDSDWKLKMGFRHFERPPEYLPLLFLMTAWY